MVPAELEAIQQDSMALGLARAIAVANLAATEQGTDLIQSLVTITEEAPPPERLWRVHYGPRNFRNRRGGDVIVLVNEHTGLVEEIIRGQ